MYLKKKFFGKFFSIGQKFLPLQREPGRSNSLINVIFWPKRKKYRQPFFVSHPRKLPKSNKNFGGILWVLKVIFWKLQHLDTSKKNCWTFGENTLTIFFWKFLFSKKKDNIGGIKNTQKYQNSLGIFLSPKHYFLQAYNI